MKKIFLTSILFCSFQVFSEEYLCSGIVGNQTETKSYERKGGYFLYTTRGWNFRILHEDETHILLGYINYYTHDDLETTLFLTIIDKETLNFSERFISSESDTDSFLNGNCSLKR
tara:strand:+ start:79 stop:423 length:345 start_codon:yes stop_codon:yes gene_type:complete